MACALLVKGDLHETLLSRAWTGGRPVPAFAATATLPNGSISLVYVTAEGVVTYQPYASISDAMAATFITWCKANYAASAGASTSSGCFNTWADDWFNQTVAKMLAASQTTATAAATAAVTAPAITPAQ